MWPCLLPCASQEILQDDNELKKNCLAEVQNGHSVHEQASEKKKYVMENIVNCLTQGKLRFFSHSLLEHQMILTFSFFRE
jgi:hypothetical protein